MAKANEALAVSDLASAREMFSVLQDRARVAGVVLRDPPPEPNACCGRGCNGCVWEGFFAATRYWQEDALRLVQRPVSVPTHQ